MSSRQLRKLQQQRELQQAKLRAEVEEEDEASEDEPVVPQKSKASVFANLAALQDEGEDNEADEEPEDPQSEPEPAPTSASKKAKKSKKKKKKAKVQQAEKTEERNGDDEIEAALRELKLKPTVTSKTQQEGPKLDPEYERVCELLGINTNYLKVGNEMKSLFGKDAIMDNSDAAGPTGRGGRRGQRQRQQPRTVDLETALKGTHAPGKGLSELTLRRNYLIQGKDDWPKATTGGLTMEVVDDESPDGTVEFRYVHDQSYQTIQETFHAFVEMGDPQNLIGLLTRTPYHISLLIQVSKIAKDQGDHALSSDLLERALFTFGRASLSLFNTKLSQGKARLDFARPENRELWLAGYHYIKSLMKKGTYRTALEWCKLLISLGPEEDSYCMYLMMHNLALRAHQFQWLMNVYEAKIPYLWYPSDEGPAYRTTPSLVLAAVALKQPTTSRELLTKSMQRLPWLFTRLFSEINLDAPPSIWGIQPTTDAESLFTELYVNLTKDLWSTPELTSLLMEIAHTITKPDLSTPPQLKNDEMNLNLVRHVYLDNSPKLMSMVPSRLLHRSNNSDSDPLPPDQNIYSYPAQRRAVEARADHYGTDDDYHNPIAALARMLPGIRRDGNNNFTEEELRRELAAFEVAQNEHDEDEDEDADGLPPNRARNAAPLSLATRLRNLFWGSAQGADEEEEEEEENTDTDEEMPGLVSGETERERRERTRQAFVESDDEDEGEEMDALVR